MKLLRLLLLLVLSGGMALAESAGPVFVIPIRTEINQPQALFVRRALKEAERAQASAVILDMDTLGGAGDAAMDQMDLLLKTKIPTITFINSKALSAGALISLATQRIYMTPSGVIGAAAPVDGQGQDLAKTMADKVVSSMAAIARGAAQKAGHNPDLADAFIRKEAQLKIDEVTLDGADTLLTLDAVQATRKYHGKPLLAEGTANTVAEVVRLADLSGPVQTIEPTGFERTAFWLSTLAPLLLLGGIVGAYIEIKTPGFGLPGIVSICCFTLFFAGSFLSGLAGWEAVIFFTIGVILVLSELFLHPGTVLPGLAGILVMLGSLVWAMVDRMPTDPLWPTNSMLQRPLLNLCVALVGSGVVIFLLAKYLPKTAFFRRIVLSESNPPGTVTEAAELVVVTGDTGTSRTTLRPSGKADFAGRIVDVVSQGEYIPAGQPVRVLEVHGPRVVVAPA